ncbi:MAG: putative addiction module antidote protein [Verrucomicrobiaceae bacterium]|nr:putative addiction module antidote protein [Verrucomicrobiaceae bacterium]
MLEKLSTFNAAEHLITVEDMAFFMADALETSDAGYIEHPKEVIARAKAIVENKKTILSGDSIEPFCKQ